MEVREVNLISKISSWLSKAFIVTALTILGKSNDAMAEDADSEGDEMLNYNDVGISIENGEITYVQEIEGGGSTASSGMA